ncbi:SAVMC3_10250 family protein [Streptomyces sp. NPDC057909]|uniref:SAVMC3_10250 family protein n=1 Tax=Streptomyces sp. NPDC057909 TaxID=3346277 RepID=UPI0036E10CDA
MFIDPQPGAVDGYEQPQGARLLLHGSSSHLLSEVSPVSLPFGPFVTGSGPPGDLLALTNLSQVSPPTAEDQDGPKPIVQGPIVESALPNAVSKLFAVAQRAISVQSSAWMRGYARVSAALRIHEDGCTPCVLATPLYVEYASDLPYPDS